MQITVYNDSEIVFSGNSQQFITDNQNDPEVIEMVQEVEQTGKCSKEFMHSGLWHIINS